MGEKAFIVALKVKRLSRIFLTIYYDVILKYPSIFVPVMTTSNNIFNFWWWRDEHLFVT